MRRRRFVVPALLALSGLGWAAAHALAHRSVTTEPAMGTTPHLGSYAGYLPTSLALCLALALPLAAGAVVGKRWRGSSLRSLWLFGLVPVVGFVGEALVEPILGGSATLVDAAGVAAALLVGLLVQIPFALLAVGLARGLLLLAAGLARVLARPKAPTAGREPERYAPPRARRPRTFSLDLSRSPRAPPSPLVA
jgi:hypothetical protein